jgi:RNA-directed DNA polymerase
VNTGAPWPELDQARARVLKIQTKLHRWASTDRGRRFDDLFNLVADPAFLTVAWERVHTNTGARTAGVDGITATLVRALGRDAELLTELRADLKDGSFRPLPARERMIPKAGGKLRRLGIPTVRDRVAQAALKLVLEPIFEADFHPCSYGFRPRRRAQDAIAEIHYLNSGTRCYEWVLEADIEACFDSIDHVALMDRIRRRVGDKRVLRLVKAFLKAGILSAERIRVESRSGTPQGGILSPLLANIALSVLDDHFAEQARQQMATATQRAKRKRHGLGNWRLVRYADDFLVLVSGTRDHAEALREQVAAVLAPIGLRLSPAKTQVVHINQGFDFLGWRIQRRRKPGTLNRHYLYTWPSKKSLNSIMAKIRRLTNSKAPHRDLFHLLLRLNAALRGWCSYFQHGVSYRTFSYLSHYTWHKVTRWLRKRHHRITWKQLRRRFLNHEGQPAQHGMIMFRPEQQIPITRYRYRGSKIPTPWTATTPATA